MRTEVQESEAARGPLVGLRVLDIGQLVAGPMAATFLADYGADVVKVERPGAGDSIRALAPYKDGESLWWKVNGRNKRCIALDLKAQEDLQTFYRLVEKADVVIENFSVGTLSDLRIDYPTLREINPSIIMLSVTGYGQTGPYSHQRAFGRTAEAFSGMSYITGFADRPPVHAGFPIADCVSGVLGALGVMSAVYERDQNPSREGQYIDLALFETVFRLMENVTIRYDQLGEVTERGGAKTSYVYPVGTWQTKDNRWASFTGSTQEMVVRLFSAIGHAEFEFDERFASNAARLDNKAELEPVITDWIAAHTLAEVLEIFEKHQVAIAPYLNIEDIFENPQYQAREAIVEVEDNELGRVRMQAVVPKFGRTPGKVRHAGRSAIGQDQKAVLSQWLGVDGE
jgi:crotonobetainyl-CoA:carnitine CoA-transferase CaiB-like acyl-CoA transferase